MTINTAHILREKLDANIDNIISWQLRWSRHTWTMHQKEGKPPEHPPALPQPLSFLCWAWRSWSRLRRACGRAWHCSTCSVVPPPTHSPASAPARTDPTCCWPSLRWSSVSLWNEAKWSKIHSTAETHCWARHGLQFLSEMKQNKAKLTLLQRFVDGQGTTFSLSLKRSEMKQNSHNWRHSPVGKARSSAFSWNEAEFTLLQKLAGGWGLFFSFSRNQRKVFS